MGRLASNPQMHYIELFTDKYINFIKALFVLCVFLYMRQCSVYLERHTISCSL